MKAGLLVSIIDPSSRMTGMDAEVFQKIMNLNQKVVGNIGKSGIILSRYQHVTATCGRDWYTVLVEGEPRTFREDYLETV